MTLTSRERIMRIFRNEEIDRPALKLWGTSLNMQLLHPAYEPVYRTALEKTDLMEKIGSPICCWAKTGTLEFQDFSHAISCPMVEISGIEPLTS